MGNIQFKDKSRVDGGGFNPNGIYSTIQDFDSRIVRKLILSRRIAPFYKGLAEISDALKEHTIINFSKRKLDGYVLNPVDFYRNAIECPICFLYYPKNINYTRCCHQPICTECFLQIKRPNPNTPATCPYCVEPNFGVVYDAPCDISYYVNGHKSTLVSRDDTKLQDSSIHHNRSEAVTSDDVRPDHTRCSPLNPRRYHSLNIVHRLLHPRQQLYRASLDVYLASHDIDVSFTEEIPTPDAFRQHGIDERSIEVVHRDTRTDEQDRTDSVSEAIEIQSLASSPTSSLALDRSEDNVNYSHIYQKPSVLLEGSTIAAC